MRRRREVVQESMPASRRHSVIGAWRRSSAQLIIGKFAGLIPAGCTRMGRGRR
jgi:hypothetical protein